MAFNRDTQLPAVHASLLTALQGCVPEHDSAQPLLILAQLAADLQHCTRDVYTATAAAAAAAGTSSHGCRSPGPSGRAPSPGPSGRQPAASPTPRRGTPGKWSGGSGAAGAVQGGGCVAGLQCLEAEGRLMEGLLERMALALDSGANWFPGDVLAAAQHQQQRM